MRKLLQCRLSRALQKSCHLTCSETVPREGDHFSAMDFRFHKQITGTLLCYIYLRDLVPLYKNENLVIRFGLDFQRISLHRA